MKFDPFAHPEKLLEKLREGKWFSHDPDYYPLSVRRCGADLYVFFAPTFRPIGISTKAGAEYCSEIFSQDILYACTRSRADLLNEIIVLKIDKSLAINRGIAAHIFSRTKQNQPLRRRIGLRPGLQSNSSKEDWARAIFITLGKHYRYWPVPSRRFEFPHANCALFKSIVQLRHLMGLRPGKHFFLKASSRYVFCAIADDFYDEERGEDHNLAEDEELGDLIRRGMEAEVSEAAAGSDHADPLDSFIDWLMEMFESDHREIPEESETDGDNELDELSRELEERLERRRIRIRPGRRRICRLLGLYSPTERLVTLFPRMWKLVAAGAGAPSAEEIGVITTLHEFAHAVSHVSHKEWALKDFIQTPSGIHEIIAERGSLKILPLYEDLLPKSDLPDVHLWLCKDAPAEYRFWKLLESVGNLGFASTLADWRKSHGVRRDVWRGLRGDDGWIKGPALFLKDCGAGLRATATSDTALADAITDLEHAFKNLTSLPSQFIKPAAGGKSIDLEPVIKALEACWEPILFGKSAALRKEFIRWRGCDVRWRGTGSQLLQLDREQLRIRLVEWLVALHAGRKAGSKGAGVAAILDPDDDDWADLIRDVVSEFDSVI
jgi:hypothetical protein